MQGVQIIPRTKTDFKSMPSPVNLYEDECVFCHSFRTSQIHGPMVRYVKGRIVTSDEGSPSNGVYVHKICLEWAPRVWFEGDTVRNLQSEIHRASRLKCHRCGLWGAALGCYYKWCHKSFHVPCAVQIDGCRWDVDQRYLLCPEHVSQVLPCDELSSQTKELFSLPQSQSLHKEAIATHCSREGQQIDQLTTSSSSLRMCCIPDEEGMSNACQGEEMELDQQETPSYHSDKLVLLGSSLSASEKDSLEKFACRTKATVTNEWVENVTHVIVGTNACREWHRAYEILMAILFGKWVVQFKWIADSLEMRPAEEDSYEVTSFAVLGIADSSEMRPAEEDSYEVTFSDDPHKPLDAPKKGRTRAAEGAPKLFSGLHFYLSAYMKPGNRGRMRNLIAAAGGSVLERRIGLESSARAPGDCSPKPYFVYDGSISGEFSVSSLWTEVQEVSEHADAGAWVVCHRTVLDAIAAYDVEVLDKRLRPRFRGPCP